MAIYSILANYYTNITFYYPYILIKKPRGILGAYSCRIIDYFWNSSVKTLTLSSLYELCRILIPL